MVNLGAIEVDLASSSLPNNIFLHFLLANIAHYSEFMRILTRVDEEIKCRTLLGIAMKSTAIVLLCNPGSE